MADGAGTFRQAVLRHEPMTAGAAGICLLLLMAADAAVTGRRFVHGPLESDSAVLIAAGQSMAFFACRQSFMMAAPAVRGKPFVGGVRKRDGVELTGGQVGFRRTQQNEVGLVPLKPGRIVDHLNRQLAVAVMTAGAVHRACGLNRLLPAQIIVTADTSLMSGLAKGYPVFFGPAVMTVPA